MIKIFKKPLMIMAFVLALAICFVAIEPSNAENDSNLKIELKWNIRAGVDRYETSVLIARSKFEDSSRAFLVSGEVFADALVIGPVAGKYNEPQYYLQLEIMHQQLFLTMWKSQKLGI